MSCADMGTTDCPSRHVGNCTPSTSIVAANSDCSPPAASRVTAFASSVGDLLHRWQDERADANGAIDRADYSAQRGRDDVRVEPDSVHGTVGTDAQLHIRN